MTKKTFAVGDIVELNPAYPDNRNPSVIRKLMGHLTVVASDKPFVTVRTASDVETGGWFLERFRRVDAATPCVFKVGDIVNLKATKDPLPSFLRHAVGPFTVTFVPAASHHNALIDLKDASGADYLGVYARRFEQTKMPAAELAKVSSLVVDSYAKSTPPLLTSAEKVAIFRKAHGLPFVPAPAPEAPKVTKTFIVAVLVDGLPAPNVKPKTYSSRNQADTVSRIMAEKHPGQTFVVFEAVSASRLPAQSATTVTL